MVKYFDLLDNKFVGVEKIVGVVFVDYCIS